jgi:hypothetical protein
MCDRFAAFLLISRWASAIVALMYHMRFLLFVDYEAVREKTSISKAFYFLTGLGHESFAIFFVLEGIAAGLVMLQHRHLSSANHANVGQHISSFYRILLPGLIVGASFDFTGVHLFNRSGLYTAFPELSKLMLSFPSLIGNALMLQPFVVPNFGSNSMLYLLSYQFWYFVLLYFCVRSADLRELSKLIAPTVLWIIVAVVRPHDFVLWGVTWLMGVAVVLLGEARRVRLSVPVTAAVFAGMLIRSLIGSMAVAIG